MIASLTGILTLIGKSEIVLEVNGVGYLLHVSSKLITSLDEIGSELTLFTDLQIRDDKIVIYGFASSKDQNIFKLLQTVQGVGPRAALSILSTLNVDELILAISSGDKVMISRADGVGPKVAGRITTELVEKVSSLNNSLFNNSISKNIPVTLQEKLNNNKNSDSSDFSVVAEDIISALVNLGYSRSEVFSVVMKIKKDFSLNNKNKNFTVSQIVPIALKELSGGL
jgi:Holliday junction DNA helicase RuvA